MALAKRFQINLSLNCQPMMASKYWHQVRRQKNWKRRSKRESIMEIIPAYVKLNVIWNWTMTLIPHCLEVKIKMCDYCVHVYCLGFLTMQWQNGTVKNITPKDAFTWEKLITHNLVKTLELLIFYIQFLLHLLGLYLDLLIWRWGRGGGRIIRGGRFFPKIFKMSGSKIKLHCGNQKFSLKMQDK